MNSEDIQEDIRELCRSGEIYVLLERYVAACTSGEEIPESAPEGRNSSIKGQRKQAKSGSFPNLAGFCRYLGIGADEFESLRTECPHEYGRALAVLEDEALNSGLSPTIISTYLKKRMGYGALSERAEDGEQLNISFEHDIFKDGE